MIAKIQSTFNLYIDDAWDLLIKRDTFLFITKGAVGFKNAKHWPDEFYTGLEISTQLIFFHILPGWKHLLHLVNVDKARYRLISKERGGFIKTWNHDITLEKISEKKCTYIDTIEIKAGRLSPVVWLYAHIFYRYRQYRWKILIRQKQHNKPSTPV